MPFFLVLNDFFCFFRSLMDLIGSPATPAGLGSHQTWTIFPEFFWVAAAIVNPP